MTFTSAPPQPPNARVMPCLLAAQMALSQQARLQHLPLWPWLLSICLHAFPSISPQPVAPGCISSSTWLRPPHWSSEGFSSRGLCFLWAPICLSQHFSKTPDLLIATALCSCTLASEHCWSGSHGCADCCHHNFTALQLSWAQGLLRVLMVPLAHPLLFSSVIFLSSHGLLISQSLLRQNRVTTSSVIPLRFFYLLYN